MPPVPTVFHLPLSLHVRQLALLLLLQGNLSREFCLLQSNVRMVWMRVVWVLEVGIVVGLVLPVVVLVLTHVLELLLQI